MDECRVPRCVMPTSPLRRSLAASLTSSNSSPTSPTSSLAPPRFVCARCRSDLTLLSDVIWEGVMGQRSEPGFLSRRVVNVSFSLPERRGVQLSSGTYDLVDVECRRCREPLGWRYLRASGATAEKFKVACTLLAAAKMERAVGLVDDGGDGDGSGGRGGGDGGGGGGGGGGGRSAVAGGATGKAAEDVYLLSFVEFFVSQKGGKSARRQRERRERENCCSFLSRSRSRSKKSFLQNQFPSISPPPNKKKHE